MTSSGFFVYGTIVSLSADSHATVAARAAEAPIKLRKRRRESGSRSEGGSTGARAPGANSGRLSMAFHRERGWPHSARPISGRTSARETTLLYRSVLPRKNAAEYGRTHQD